MIRVWAMAACALVANALAAAPGTPQTLFEGNALFSEPRLLQALRQFDVTLNEDVTSADDAAFFLREFYFERGFPEANVTYEFRPGRVVFRIDEGGRVWLGRVRFEGGETLTRDRVEAVFSAAMRQALREPFGRLPFVEAAVVAGTERLRETFVSEGFLDTAVAFTTAPSLVRDGLDVTVTIYEGTRYGVRDITILGAPAAVHEALTEALSVFRNKPYRPGDEVLVRLRTADFLRSRGYFLPRPTRPLGENQTAGSTSSWKQRPGRRSVSDVSRRRVTNERARAASSHVLACDRVRFSTLPPSNRASADCGSPGHSRMSCSRRPRKPMAPLI